MKIHHLALGLTGLSLMAAPAAARDYRYCMTILKDGGGTERALLMGPVLPVDSVPNFNQAWTDYSKPVAEAAMRQHNMRGSVAVNCTVGEALSETLSHRSKIVSLVNRRGLLLTEVDWDPAAPSARRANAGAQAGSNASDDLADAGGREDRAEDRATQTARSETRSQPVAPKFIGAPDTAPPVGYSDWKVHARRTTYKGFDVPVRVDYAYRVMDNEIRVVWRCTNATDVDVSCSIGAGGDKEYQCWAGNTSLGSTRSLGERATAGAGRSYTFPSDWACRGLGATSVAPIARISIE